MHAIHYFQVQHLNLDCIDDDYRANILTLQLQTLSASRVKCDRCTLHFADDDTDGCGEDAHSSAAKVGAVE